MKRKTTSGTPKALSPSARPDPRKRILLVDDHPMMRVGLAQIIGAQDDLVLCGEAADAAEGMHQVTTTHPDLVVLDLSLEGKSGLELIKDLQALYPQLPILVMSMHDELLYAERVLRAGARGYVMKKNGGETLIHAIREVLSGRRYVSETMAAHILASFSGPRPEKKKSSIEILTDREFEVLKLIGEGCSKREIGARLHISQKTVDVYRQHLKEKFKLPDSSALIQHAVRWVQSQNQT